MISNFYYEKGTSKMTNTNNAPCKWKIALLADIQAPYHTYEYFWWKSESEARNLPSCGCKSMAEGPRNVLGVFITLLYTYTMPINYYSSKPTSLRCHLMAKCCLKAGRNRNLRQEICHHVAVKVWRRALEMCWECSSLCYILIQCQSTTILASLHLWGATWWPNVAWKPAEIGIWGKKSAIMWL